jgi:imidazolonepropionase-like amidohydrolase
LLKKYHVPVIYEHTLATPIRRDEPVDTRYTAPKKLYDAGISFCLSASSSTFEAPHQRNVPYEAAMAAAFGLPPAEALRAITLSAAEILGVADKVGSLEPGKDATLIVTDGDPLEITTHVELAFIQGRPVDLDNRHRMLYRKYRQKYIQRGDLPASRD